MKISTKLNSFSYYFQAVFCILLLVLYIFNIVPKGGFAKLGTREYLSVIAVIYFTFFKVKLPRVIWILYFANWTQVFFSIITVLANETTDFWYIQFSIRNILYLTGALFLVRFFPKSMSFNKFLYYIVIAIVINSVIAAVAFVTPSVMNILVNIQQLNEEKTSRTIEFAVRMIGLGKGNLYPGGVINGMGILIACHLIAKQYLSLFRGGVLILLMFIIGLFIARTTIVGAILGFIYYLKVGKIRRLFSLFILFTGLFLIITITGILDNISTAHAFEIFDSDKGGLFHNKSMNDLWNMYKFEVNSKTLLFGDGLSKLNGGYYMQVDAGYLRNVFYFGILGTLFGYAYYEFMMFYEWSILSPKMKNFIYFTVLYLIFLNIKGLPDFNFFIFLFIAFITNRKRLCNLSHNK